MGRIVSIQEWEEEKRRRELKKALKLYHIELVWSDYTDITPLEIFSSFEEAMAFIAQSERMKHLLGSKLFRDDILISKSNNL